MANRYVEPDITMSRGCADEEDADAAKAALAFLLLKTTDMDSDEIYSLVFRSGSKIIWH